MKMRLEGEMSSLTSEGRRSVTPKRLARTIWVTSPTICASIGPGKPKVREELGVAAAMLWQAAMMWMV